MFRQYGTIYLINTYMHVITHTSPSVVASSTTSFDDSVTFAILDEFKVEISNNTYTEIINIIHIIFKIDFQFIMDYLKRDG